MDFISLGSLTKRSAISWSRLLTNRFATTYVWFFLSPPSLVLFLYATGMNLVPGYFSQLCVFYHVLSLLSSSFNPLLFSCYFSLSRLVLLAAGWRKTAKYREHAFMIWNMIAFVLFSHFSSQEVFAPLCQFSLLVILKICSIAKCFFLIHHFLLHRKISKFYWTAIMLRC